MFQLGHRPDVLDLAAEDLELRHASGLVGVGAPSASERDWRFLDPVVLSQGRSNTCVPHAGGKSLFLFGQGAKLRGTGDAIPMPSIRHAYCQGQFEDQRIDGVPIERRQVVDLGMRARSMLQAWSTYGIVSEERWPFDDTRVTEPLPFDLDVAAADAKLTGWFRADSGTMSQSFRRSLDVCTFPIVAIDVYQNFMDHQRGTYVDVAGQFIGRHMLVADHYGPGFVGFRNSWSAGWGDGGWVRIADRYLDSEYARDGWLLTAAPPLH